MTKIDTAVSRGLKLRAIILNALDALECFEDPPPSDVDLIEIALLLGQAPDLLGPPRGEFSAELDKADATIDELDRRLASIEPCPATIIDLREILRRRNAMDVEVDPAVTDQ